MGAVESRSRSDGFCFFPLKLAFLMVRTPDENWMASVYQGPALFSKAGVKLLEILETLSKQLALCVIATACCWNQLLLSILGKLPH